LNFLNLFGVTFLLFIIINNKHSKAILQTILPLLKNIEIKEESNKLLSEKQKLKSICSEFKTLIMHNN
jgi:hypothetical protein